MNRANFGANTNAIQMIVDSILVVIGYGAVFLLLGLWVETYVYQSVAVLVAIFGAFFILLNKARDLYNVTRFAYLDRVYVKMTTSFLMAAVVTVVILCYFIQDELVNRYYIGFLGIEYVILVLKVFMVRPLNRWSRRKDAPRTVYVGDETEYQKFFGFWEKTSIRMQPIGYVAKSHKEYEDNKANYIGSIANLETLIREHNIDQIYILQRNADELQDVQEYLDLCITMGVTVRLVMDLYESHSAYGHVSEMGTYPVITYHTVTLNTGEQILKRALDLLCGMIGLVLTLPIMCVTAVLIKLDSPGPVLYRQVRVGKNGRQFQIYKFRSMYVDEETKKEELMAQNEIEGGVMFKMKNDPRITPVGKWIRRLSIDELPQFFNVLQGSMSLVGTRPPTLDEVEKYNCNHWRRISIKPGITGLWQVSGRSNISSFEEIVEKDIEYIDNWSLLGDLKIILKTFVVLAKHNDAY